MQKNSRKYYENVKWKKKLTVNSVAPGVAVEEVEAAAAAAFFLLCNFDEKILFGELNFFSSFSKRKIMQQKQIFWCQVTSQKT